MSNRLLDEIKSIQFKNILKCIIEEIFQPRTVEWYFVDFLFLNGISIF
jgi:hypothetical protein